MSPPWLGLSIRDQIISSACHYIIGLAQEARIVATPSCWAEFLQGSGSIGDPGFMNPTGAPKPFWDFYEVMKGMLLELRCFPPLFVVPRRVTE